MLPCMLVACVLPRSAESPVHTYLLTIDEAAWSINSRATEPGRQGVLVVGLSPGFVRTEMTGHGGNVELL